MMERMMKTMKASAKKGMSYTIFLLAIIHINSLLYLADIYINKVSEASQCLTMITSL